MAQSLRDYKAQLESELEELDRQRTRLQAEISKTDALIRHREIQRQGRGSSSRERTYDLSAMEQERLNGAEVKLAPVPIQYQESK